MMKYLVAQSNGHSNLGAGANNAQQVDDSVLQSITTIQIRPIRKWDDQGAITLSRCYLPCTGDIGTRISPRNIP